VKRGTPGYDQDEIAETDWDAATRPHAGEVLGGSSLRPMQMGLEG
jgi:hypothetical protein